MAAFAAAALSTVASAIGTVGSTAVSAIGSAGSAVGSVIGSGGGTIASGVGAGGWTTTVTQAGSGLLGALKGGTSLATSLLSGGLSVGSALSAARAGAARGDAALIASETAALGHELAAGDALIEAQVEGVRGLERRNSLRRMLLDVIGERDVAAAASGVDLSFGTPVAAREQAVHDTERALETDRATQDFRVTRLNERAQGYRLLAEQQRRSGRVQAGAFRDAGNSEAIGIAGSGLLNALRRG